jgi:hypothetical protein
MIWVNWEAHNLEQKKQRDNQISDETLHIVQWEETFWITEHSKSQVPRGVFVRKSYPLEPLERHGYSVDIWSSVDVAMRLTLCSPLTRPLWCSTSVLQLLQHEAKWSEGQRMYQLFHPTCKLLLRWQAFGEKDPRFHLEARCYKPLPTEHLNGRGTNILGYWKCTWILLLLLFDIYQTLASFESQSADQDLFQRNWRFLPWDYYIVFVSIFWSSKPNNKRI